MTMLSAADRRQLDELGYLVLSDFVPATVLEEMCERVEALWAEEGDDAGTEFRLEPGTRRLANLVDKGDVFVQMIVMPGILECIGAVIGPDYKLSSLNARSVAAGRQLEHQRRDLHALQSYRKHRGERRRR
jgi:hypothetical protein